jgi:hypothetical protein
VLLALPNLALETLMSVPIATRFAPLSLLVPCDLRDLLYRISDQLKAEV